MLRSGLSSGASDHRGAESANDAQSGSATDTPEAAQSLGVAFVGCFTTQQRRARGIGIDAYRLGTTTDPARWTSIGRIEGLANPSLLLSDPRRLVLYAVHGDGDQASAFAVEAETGRLRSLGSVETGGLNGVHLALDRSGCFLVVANYATGSVAVMPVRPDGSLEAARQVLDLPGNPGPHRREQTSAHPHQIVFDPSGAFVLVPDKGLDRVFVLAFDAAEGRLEIVGHAPMRPGAGPRHLVFHPGGSRAFLVNELESTVATLSWSAADGVLTPLGIVPTLPPDFFGASTAAAIVVTPCGRYVYATNRGQDGIARLTYESASDRLVPKGWTLSEGRDPRFMTLDPSGDRLLVANEQGDSLVAFAIDPETGGLAPAGMRYSPSPCSLAFL